METTENKIKEENKEAKEEEEPEEEGEDKMWTFLEHKGPVFVPPYEPLPANIKFYYDGEEIKLSPQTEEVASFYARMLNHDYTTRKIFNDNFFHDWKKVMTESERLKITELKKCDFRKMHAYYKEKSRKYAKKEKQAMKEKSETLTKEFGFCNVDGLEEKISNFKIAPPGLFRGGEENPRSGIVRRRIEPEDVIINCSKDSKVPEPPSGHKWKEVRHDDTVTWLASWDENVENRVKYMMLDPSPKLKEEEEPEEKGDDDKGTFLEHKGPVFAPPYEPLPANVKFCYDGEEMALSPRTEEVASFYARMLNHDYTTKKIFQDNFFHDWKKVMTDGERIKIAELEKCDFRKMHAYYKEKSQSRTKEEKQAMKEKNELFAKEFGFCNVDGREEKIINFIIASPGLFRGGEEDPKIGRVRRRVEPEDVIINCSKDSKVPAPPSGHKWKEVRHDDTVTWLASWDEDVENRVKYMTLTPSPKLQDEKDCQKYEIARKLHRRIDYIRAWYRFDWKSRHIYVKQKGTVMYFIDKFGLRPCNEDEEQEIAGLSSLRVEHVTLHEKKDGKDYVVVIDFVGKDSFRYYNEAAVEKLVFKNLLLFTELKKGEDALFDRLEATSTTSAIIRGYVCADVSYTTEQFNIYNASWTLQQKLDEYTNADDSVAERILSYIRSMRAVAILRNHKSSVPKWEQLEEKIQTKEVAAMDAERQISDKKAKHGGIKGKTVCEEKKQQQNQIKLEIQEGDMDEIKYLDPRITVAWCKKYGVPIENIYNKIQRDKFRWAINTTDPDYVFCEPIEDQALRYFPYFK